MFRENQSTEKEVDILLGELAAGLGRMSLSGGFEAVGF